MGQSFVLLAVSFLLTAVSGLLLFIGNDISANIRAARKEMSELRDKIAYRIEQVNTDLAVLTQRFDDLEKSIG